MRQINYGQDTLFGKKVISTIGYDEQEMIRDILYLHARGKQIDCDPTYSIGNFYKDGIQKPKYKFDLNPQLPEVEQADARKLPLPDNSINVLMFDPPFIMGTSENFPNGSGEIGTRFYAFKDFEELKTMYYDSLNEFHRILAPLGILIFKCQDCVSSGKNHFTHSWVMNAACNIGFYPKDLFIYAVKNRIVDVALENQQHARKFHSYFWVFEKKECKVNYNINP